MEIGQSDFANIVGVSRQNIYKLYIGGKLIKSESGKFFMHEPHNLEYLKSKGKSLLDVENYMSSKKKPAVPLSSGGVSSVQVRKAADNSAILIKAIGNVINRLYGGNEAQKVKKMILDEYRGMV